MSDTEPKPDPETDPAPKPVPCPPKYAWLVVLREVTTTVVALIVVGVTMYLLYLAFCKAGAENKTEVMLHGLPILGAVIGYYFGRVPAERRAEASENAAAEAQKNAEKANEQAKQTEEKTQQTLLGVKVGMERAKAKMEDPQQPGLVAPAHAAAYAELEKISALL